MAMKTRITILALILALMLCGLSGCGKAKDDTFTVDYVARANMLIIVGQYNGKQAKMSADAFKDCTLTMAENLDGEVATLSGTEDGLLKIDGGVRLTLQDADGNTHTVDVKEGTKLKVDTSDKDAWRFLLPE